MGQFGKNEVQAVYERHANSETGLLETKSLYRVCSELGLPTSSKDLVQLQGALRALYDGASIEEGIPFPLFFRWYKLETGPGHFEDKNELLVRRVIGKVKYPTRNLKDNSFVYGEKNRADPEGAGEVVLNWVPGTLSESKEAGVCLIKVNKAAIANKKVTPKDLNAFLRENKNAKHLQKPKIVGKKKDRGPKRDPDAVYGVSSHLDQSKEDFTKVIFPESMDHEDPHYVDTSGQVKKGRLPRPRPTKCSEMLQQHTRATREEKTTDQWKMQKFTKNAKAKIVMK